MEQEKQQIRMKFDSLEYWQWEASNVLISSAMSKGYTELATEMINDI